MLAAAHQVEHAQLQAAFDALGNHEVPGEEVEVVEHDELSRGDDLFGVRQVWLRRIDRDEAEVAAGVVDAGEESAVAVLNLVFDVGVAQEDDAQEASTVDGSRVGIDHLHLRRIHALARDDHVAAVERARHAEREQLVGLFEQQRVGRIAAHHVAPEPARPLGLVHGDVVERATVVGPGDGSHLRHGPRIEHAVAQVLELQRVVAAAGAVERAGEAHAVAAHGKGAEAQERLAARQLVEVEQGLVDTVRVEATIVAHGAAAQVARILFARLRPGGVPPVAFAHRHRVVVLLDAREHLLVERFLQRRVRREPGLGIGVLGPQDVERAGVVAVAHPVVVVDAMVAVDAHVFGLARCDRRLQVGSWCGHGVSFRAALRSPIGGAPWATSERSRSSTPGNGSSDQRRVRKRRIDAVS